MVLEQKLKPEGQTQMGKASLLEVIGLKKYYPIRQGIIPHTVDTVKAVDGLDFTLYRGETLGLVGESGCGKSTVGRQVVGLEAPTAGEILLNGQPLKDLFKNGGRESRTRLQMIFQDSFSSLNPRKHIGDILAAPMMYHGLVTQKTVWDEVGRLLNLVGLPSAARSRYPHEFSGGQRQRVGIAKALSLKPELIVCDEPVSALDVSIQAQILNLLKDLQKELSLTYLFIGHGLAAVNYVSDRIAVMYLGKIVEIAPARDIFFQPAHPYTKALCDAAPLPDPKERDRDRMVLPGEIPSSVNPPSGCRFHPRCPYAIALCREKEPALAGHAGFHDSHLAACHLAETLAQKRGGLEI